jgi:hypothetical protein
LQYPPVFRRRLRPLLALALLLVGATRASAADSYNPATRQLTIPSVSVIYANVVLAIADIVSHFAVSGAPSNRRDLMSPWPTLLSTAREDRTASAAH